MSNRGMVKFAPFKSLIEQAECLQQMRYKKNKISRPIISQDQKAKINAILSDYHGETLKFTFFNDGYLYEFSKPIKKIDLDKKVLVFEEGELRFIDIVDIVSDDVEQYF